MDGQSSSLVYFELLTCASYIVLKAKLNNNTIYVAVMKIAPDVAGKIAFVY